MRDAKVSVASSGLCLVLGACMLLGKASAAEQDLPNVRAIEAEPSGEITIENISRSPRVTRASVDFSVAPVVHPNVDADCVRTPLFTSGVRRADVQAALSRGFEDRRLSPITIIESKAATVTREMSGLSQDIWRKSSEKNLASCVSKCVALPSDARPTKISLLGAQGVDVCLEMPSERDASFDNKSARCPDGSYWLEVAAHPALGGDWLVCATAANVSSTRPTLHRLEITFKRQSVVTIGND